MESNGANVNTFRLVITRRNGSEILLLPRGNGWVLPQAAIHRHQRVAEQLTEAVRKAWKLETYCLLIPGPTNELHDDETKPAVLESVQANDKAPAGSYWAPRAAAAGFLEAGEASLVRSTLGELEAYTKNVNSGPFARPGWLWELFRWTREEARPLGVQLTGGFRQLNAIPTFCLLRLDTRTGAVWFKATGEPNAHELPLTLAISRLFPRYVPRVLGVHQSWNGWLTEEVAGVALDESTEFAAWECAAEDLAELQIASIGLTADLLEAQAKDLRIARLAERIDPFLERMGELMALQEKATPAPLANSELATLAEGLKEASTLLEELRLPDTLGHLDFNPGNIVTTAEGTVFLDWSEGCVSHPFLTFEYLREHLGRSKANQPGAGERLAAGYLNRWAPFYSQESLRRAQAVAPLLAAFAYAVSNDRWRSAEPLQNPPLAGYYRSLARRMYRESIQAAVRSERCLN